MIELKPKGARYWIHGVEAEHPELYNVWKTMLHRCENPRREKYAAYGGRGIKVCADWHDPREFVKWAMLNGYRSGLQLDRTNNDGDYEPKNCRFVTPKQNSRNRRNTKKLTLHGETKCVSEWCETINVSPYTVYWWIREKGVAYAEQRLSEIA